MSKDYQRSLRSYQLVLSSLEREGDALRKNLKELNTLQNAEQDKKRILEEYKCEYIDKVNNNISTSAVVITRYRTFIYQLDALIAEQNRKLQLLNEKNTGLVKELGVKCRKINVVNELISKKTKKENSRQEKAQQIIIDDIASRKYQAHHEADYEARI